MQRDEFIAMRVPGAIKRELQEIADAEERSLSQICYLFLRFSILEYRKRGLKFLREALETRGKVEEGE